MGNEDIHGEWGQTQGVKIYMRSSNTDNAGIYIEKKYKTYIEKRYIWNRNNIQSKNIQNKFLLVM